MCWSPSSTSSTNSNTTPTSTTVVPAPDTTPIVKPNSTNSWITVLSPNGGEKITLPSGKDVDLRVNWASSNLSGKANIYLIREISGQACLLGSVPVSYGTFALEGGKEYKCKNLSSDITDGEYKILIETDSSLVPGKFISDKSNSSFTIIKKAISTNPIITVLYPNGGETLTVGVKAAGINARWTANYTPKDPSLYIYSPINGNIYSQTISFTPGLAEQTVNIPDQAILPGGGEFKVTICDNGTYRTDIPFKPVCDSSDDYFTEIDYRDSADSRSSNLNQMASTLEAARALAEKIAESIKNL